MHPFRRGVWHNHAMSNSTEVPSKSRLHTVAVVFASLIIAAPLLMGKVVEAIMDSANPAGLKDVDVPLAYLTQILISSLIALVLVVLGYIIAMITLYLRDRSIKAISLPLTVGIVQIVLGVIMLVLNQVVSGAGG